MRWASPSGSDVRSRAERRFRPRQTMIIDTEQGPYRGQEGRVDRFLGIRFAAAPVGEQRWRLPQPVEAHGATRDALAFGEDCPQPASPFTRATSQGEDCLSLNIWTPHDRGAAALPVLLWLPGGGFIGGSGSDARTDGAALAERGMVVVTANYRVGIFGYFAHPGLTSEAQGASGNYGLHDAAAALGWVRRNISAFGGDPARITLGGVSAGSAQAALLLTAEGGVERPHQLLLQSPGSMRPLARLEQAELDGASVGHDLDRLRQLSKAELLDLTRYYTDKPRALTRSRTLRPIIDGSLILRDEREAHVTRQFAAMPTLIGNCLDEGAQLARRLTIADPASFATFLEEQFGPDAEEAAVLYPAQTSADVPASLAAVYGDTQFTYGGTALAASLGKRTAVWRYLFAFSDGEQAGPFHGGDVPFTFGVDARVDGVATRADSAAADAMAATATEHWTRFITIGDPGWPACGPDAEPYRHLSNDPRLEQGWRSEQMLFLDRHFAPSGGGMLLEDAHAQ